MLGGMMDPELMRLAQEQMSRMSPADFARIQQQMMDNPGLMRMASESMKNMRPEDLRNAAEQLKHTRPEEMAEISEKMANATPEEIATMRARVDGQINYELNAAEMLKKQGNELHSQCRYSDASQKYLLAKKNLNRVSSSKGKTLRMACSLNLMSCYLKITEYHKCIEEGSEVLAYDTNNIKALYRRGQAYKEMGRLRDAINDLTKAHELSSEDETICDVLRDAKDAAKGMTEKRDENETNGVIIEEISEENEAVSSVNNKNYSQEDSVSKAPEINESSRRQSTFPNGGLTNTEYLQALKDDPETIRSFQNFISKADPDSLAAMNFGKAGEISPDMVKIASQMIGKMSPQELQKMLEAASSFQSENPYSMGGSTSSTFPKFGGPNMTPDMLKTANDMMSNVSPDDLQKMFEMSASLKGKDTIPSTSSGITRNSDTGIKFSDSQANNESSGADKLSSSHSRNASALPSFPTTTGDLQEQMRNQMKDPAMQKMFSSMIKNMSPEMMANMSEQFGLKLSQEDAVKAQQAMSSLGAEDLDRMMRWADRIQRCVEGAKKTKNLLLGRQGMILAVCMLVLAVILHRLGFIGS